MRSIWSYDGYHVDVGTQLGLCNFGARFKVGDCMGHMTMDEAEFEAFTNLIGYFILLILMWISHRDKPT